jgi:hypothetical protein
MHGSTIDLLYYCNRPGWAIASDQTDLATKLAEVQRQGANLFVVCNLRDLDANQKAADILSSLATIAEGDDYRIYRLGRPVVRSERQGRAR